MKEIADILSNIMTSTMEITNIKNKTGNVVTRKKTVLRTTNHYCHFKTKINVITEIEDNIVGK